MSRVFGAVVAVVAAAAFVGCGDPAVPTVKYSPEVAAAEAMSMYDANNDGKLDAAELKKCPSIGSSLSEIDKNGDKCIDAGEIAARIASYATSGTKLRVEHARVIRGKRPVKDVTVTLEPEKFMGGTILPATGVSNETGQVNFQTEGMPYEGMQIGFFLVKLSQKDGAGKELLPAKFNTSTVFGVEIGPNNHVNLIIDLGKDLAK